MNPKEKYASLWSVQKWLVRSGFPKLVSSKQGAPDQFLYWNNTLRAPAIGHYAGFAWQNERLVPDIL